MSCNIIAKRHHEDNTMIELWSEDKKYLWGLVHEDLFHLNNTPKEYQIYLLWLDRGDLSLHLGINT